MGPSRLVLCLGTSCTGDTKLYAAVYSGCSPFSLLPLSKPTLPLTSEVTVQWVPTAVSKKDDSIPFDRLYSG